MNELIEQFILTNFSEEYQDLVLKSFSIFDAYGYDRAPSEFVDNLMLEGVTSIESRVDSFNATLHKCLDYVLEQHMVSLSDTAKISDKVQVLEILYILQSLEDYGPIETVLENYQLDSTDKLAQIFTLISDMDECKALEILDEVDDKVITRISSLIASRARNKLNFDEGIDPKVVDNYKLFCTTFEGDHLSKGMVEMGTTIGYPMSVYLPFVEDSLVSASDEETAMNILSIIYMSEQGKTDVLGYWRDISSTLSMEPSKVARVDTHVIRLIGILEQARTVNNEKE